LAGPVTDQAALHGLLDTLYALHLPILEVTKVDGRCESKSTMTEDPGRTKRRTR
jgi:hypothetical protein